MNQTVNILKMQPVLREIDFAYMIYRSGNESQNSRECFPMTSKAGIFNIAKRTLPGFRPQRGCLYFSLRHKKSHTASANRLTHSQKIFQS